jgi:predicted acyl esterase
LGEGLTFLTQPLEEETEILGPSSVTLFISSDTTDADVFVVLRVFSPDMHEVTFVGSNDPRTPIAHGWLRASHRQVDPGRSFPYRPFHTHEELTPLTPGEVTELAVEIWPTSIVIPPGYRIALTIRGRDYVHPGATPQPIPAPGTGTLSGFEGVGPFRHTDPGDRGRPEFGGEIQLHWGADLLPSLLLPMIPTDSETPRSNS